MLLRACDQFSAGRLCLKTRDSLLLRVRERGHQEEITRYGIAAFGELAQPRSAREEHARTLGRADAWNSRLIERLDLAGF